MCVCVVCGVCVWYVFGDWCVCLCVVCVWCLVCVCVCGMCVVFGVCVCVWCLVCVCVCVCLVFGVCVCVYVCGVCMCVCVVCVCVVFGVCGVTCLQQNKQKIVANCLRKFIFTNIKFCVAKLRLVTFHNLHY